MFQNHRLWCDVFHQHSGVSNRDRNVNSFSVNKATDLPDGKIVSQAVRNKHHCTLSASAFTGDACFTEQWEFTLEQKGTKTSWVMAENGT